MAYWRNSFSTHSWVFPWQTRLSTFDSILLCFYFSLMQFWRRATHVNVNVIFRRGCTLYLISRQLAPEWRIAPYEAQFWSHPWLSAPGSESGGRFAVGLKRPDVDERVSATFHTLSRHLGPREDKSTGSSKCHFVHGNLLSIPSQIESLTRPKSRKTYGTGSLLMSWWRFIYVFIDLFVGLMLSFSLTHRALEVTVFGTNGKPVNAVLMKSITGQGKCNTTHTV